MGEDLPDRRILPGAKFARRYTVVESIKDSESGGVYKAVDDSGRVVAIKTMTFHEGTEAAARSDMERRFRRETRLAREINHPHVARIHDIGDLDGLHYVTMAFVEGEKLSAVIHQQGALPVPETLLIASQLADGLAAAHAMGVIHRNLKPENVMITPTGAVIMDVGMARSNATQTGFGGISGAVEYMAPEQSRGTGVDARADVYAWGLIVYDMLTGRKRLQGHESPMAELLFRMRNSPTPLHKLVADVPPPLEEAVNRATHPNPDRRFRDAAELRAGLPSFSGGATHEGRRSWWQRWR